MGRKKANALGRGIPQKSKSGTSKHGGRRNHHPYRVFGDGPNSSELPSSTPPPKEKMNYYTPARPNLYRAPIPVDVVAVRNFVISTNGKTKEKFRTGIKHGIVRADLMDLIRLKFGTDTDEVIKEFIANHQDPIPYEVKRVYSHIENDGVLMKAVPTSASLDALNQDFADAQQTFGIEEPYRHRTLIVAKYGSMDDFTEAFSVMQETLQRQGGVLLTFGGVQLPTLNI